MGDYSLILTNQGLAKIASAIANSAQINLIQIALGDGNGITPTPDASQTALVHEVKRINISSKTVNSQNTNQIIIEGYIPAADSGYQIREIGIFDNTGTLIAVGKHPFVDKLNATSGAVVDLYIKQFLTVTNSAVFTIEVDSTAMFVLKSGDSMTGNLIIPAGTAPGHAVNKGQLDQKQATITGGATTIASNNLANSKALVSDSSGKVAVGGATSTEVGYLSGVTFPIQPQIDKIAIAGRIDYFAMSTAPAGYLKCNGATISRTTYSALFAAIGTIFGTGDGSTTFNLPDLRGEFIRGWDDSRGVDSGRVFGSYQADIFKSHYHGGVPFSMADSDRGTGNASFFSIDTAGGITGSTGGTETRPRNIALLACIKY